MSARQREGVCAMIEVRWRPQRCAVPVCAIVTEVPRNMIRICCLLELLLMALVAIRVMQLVVAIHMARLARCCNVSTGQREECRAMVKRCRVPVRC